MQAGDKMRRKVLDWMDHQASDTNFFSGVSLAGWSHSVLLCCHYLAVCPSTHRLCGPVLAFTTTDDYVDTVASPLAIQGVVHSLLRHDHRCGRHLVLLV